MVLHDALLQHLFMGTLDEKLRRRFVFNYGNGAAIWRELWPGAPARIASGLLSIPDATQSVAANFAA